MTRQVDDLDSDYAAAGFGGTLGWGASPAIVVIDVCQAYLDPGSPLYAGVEAAKDSVRTLVEAARSAGVPVVWTRVEYEPGGGDGGVFFRKVASLEVFVRDATHLGDFPPDVSPADGEEIYTKQYPSAFFGTALAGDLAERGIDTVVLCGFSTSGCVRASCVDAMSYGFIPVIVPEACGDREARPHDQAIFDMGAKYGEIVTLADTLAHLATRH
jgi:maleamate amidohydrolase